MTDPTITTSSLPSAIRALLLLSREERQGRASGREADVLRDAMAYDDRTLTPDERALLAAVSEELQQRTTWGQNTAPPYDVPTEGWRGEAIRWFCAFADAVLRISTQFTPRALIEHHRSHSVGGLRAAALHPERIAARGGFGYEEITTLLGHPPTTWRREPTAMSWPQGIYDEPAPPADPPTEEEAFAIMRLRIRGITMEKGILEAARKAVKDPALYNMDKDLHVLRAGRELERAAILAAILAVVTADAETARDKYKGTTAARGTYDPHDDGYADALYDLADKLRGDAPLPKPPEGDSPERAFLKAFVDWFSAMDGAGEFGEHGAFRCSPNLYKLGRTAQSLLMGG